MKNPIISQLQEFIRTPYTFPGGYPKMLVMHDGECLCKACAKSEYRLISNSTRKTMRDGWQAMGVDINWESPDMYCAHCGKQIESAYGDD